MADPLTIRCKTSESTASFELKDSDYFVATLTSGGLHARLEIAYFGDSGIDRFWQDMADNWRGWKEEKTWMSLEGQLRLTSRIDPHGHVTIVVDLFERQPIGWSASLQLQAEAGQLESYAKDARHFAKSLRARS